MGEVASVCSNEKKQSYQKNIKQIRTLQKQLKKHKEEKDQYRQEIQLLKKQLQTKKEKEAERDRQRQQADTIQSDNGQKTIRKQQNFNPYTNNSDENELKEQKQISKKKAQDYEKKIQQFEKLLKQKDRKSKQLENQLNELQSKYKEFKKKEEDIQNQNIKSNSKQKDYQQQIQSLEKLLQQKDLQTKQLEARLNQLEQKDAQLEQRQANLQRLICDLRDQLQLTKRREQEEELRYQKSLEQLKKTINSLDSEKQFIISQIDKARKQLLQKQQKIKQNTKQSEEQKQLNKKNLQELSQKCLIYQKQLQSKNKQIEKFYDEMNAVKNNQNQRNSKKQTSITDLRQKLDQCIKELDKVRLSRNRKSIEVAQIRYNSFFNAELLQDENDYKQFLVSAIEARMNKKISKTKLIYKYDQLNKLNIHKYIDNKYFLVLVIKLQSGYYLATFTQGPFYPQMQSKYDGMIISLTNRKVFVPLVKNKRAIAYDDFFIIFGNSEVRLKSQQKKIFSNFAISNGYYNANGEKVSILLGTNVREVPLESYEFYELSFK